MAAIFSELKSKLPNQPPRMNNSVLSAVRSLGWSNMNYETLIEVQDEEEVYFAAGFKNSFSYYRKAMERGISPEDVLTEIRDLYRAAVVIGTGKNIAETICKFMEKVILGADSIGKIEVDGIDIKGHEEEWKVIEKRLRQICEENNLQIEIGGESKQKSSASKPKFKWIKFAFGCSKNGATEWIEFHFFHGQQELEKKKADDRWYVFRRMFNPGPNAQPSLRMFLCDEDYIKLVPYSPAFTEED